MAWNKLDPGKVEEIVARYVAGESQASLAKEFSVTIATISQHVRRRVGNIRSSRNLPDSVVEVMVARFLEGETAASIAVDYEWSSRTVSARIGKRLGRNIGRIRRVPGVYPPADIAKLAYLAAILDAEGCLSQPAPGSKAAWQVTITNTSEELRQWLEPMGGAFYEVPLVSRSGQSDEFRKPVWVWKVTAAWDVITLLEAVEPFLIIKEQKARVVVDSLRDRFGEPSWNWDESED